MQHILIVEDEPAIADTLLYACKDANMQATHVLLGGDALRVFGEKSFDLLILDIGLPDISGFEVCKKLRETSQVPILFLTARNHEVDRIVGLEIGADDYVTKPFSPREIIARIHAILRRGQSKSAPAQQTFLVDELANRIQYRGQFLELTRYEFLLLKTLIKQPQRVFSRDQLMDLVWINAENTLERTVDAHIKTLRAKLKAVDAASETIVTHRGMGYSLLA